MHSTASLAACPLDPYEDNSKNGPDFWLRDHEKGEIRAQFEAAFSDPVWGTDRGRCGGAVLFRWDGSSLSVVPALCDSWGCRICGVRKGAHLRQEVQKAQGTYGLDSFWTLTCRTRSVTALESYAFVQKGWNICRTHLAHDYGRFSFVKVVESTKRGYCHLHLLASLDMTPGELSSRWLRATDTSWQVSAESVSTERAGNYITKYCAKEARLRAERFGGWRRVGRVYATSRDIRFSPLRGSSDGSWKILRAPWRTVVPLVESAGPLVTQRIRGTPYVEVTPTSSGTGLVALMTAQPVSLQADRKDEAR